MTAVQSASISSVNLIPYLLKGKKKLTMADIGHLPRLNYRHYYGTGKELISLAEQFETFGGWDSQQSICAEVATPAEVKEMVEYREAALAMLKDNLQKLDVNKDDGKWAKYLLEGFEALYCDEKGKVIPPFLIGTTCNRRASIFHMAKAIAIRDGHEFRDTIQVVVPDNEAHRFPDAGCRQEAQLRENGKDENFRPTTDEENLEAVRDQVVTYGKAQSDIRKTFNATMGLRYYFAVIVDLFCKRMAAASPKSGWKKINFLSRLLMPKFLDKEGKPSASKVEGGKDNPEALEFRKFQQAAFQGDTAVEKDNPLWDYGMGNACEADSKFEKANKERKAGKNRKILTRPTIGLMDTWIEHNMTKGSSIKPIMKKGTFESLQQTSCLPLLQFANAALNDDLPMLDVIKEKTDAYNAVFNSSVELNKVLGPALAQLQELDDDTALPIVQKFLDDIAEAVAAIPTPAASEEVVEEEVPEEVEA